jgi:hypothetical protein
MISILNGLFSLPTVTPPWALISSVARVIALAASQPYRKAVAKGAPMTIGFPCALALDPENEMMKKLKARNKIPANDQPFFLIFLPPFLIEIPPSIGIR